jgi:hypothetical protein
MDEIRAGIAALGGDRATGLAGYRDARARFQDLGLAWDIGLLAIFAASTLGTDEPEVASWLAEARTLFEKLRTAPILRLVDRLAAGGTPTTDVSGAASSRDRPGTGPSGTSQPAESVPST